MKIKNLYAYSKERFPFINMMLFVILFFTVVSVAQYSIGDWVKIGWKEVAGAVAVISFFFRLRVFDEIKDYAIDSINHPHRILQSGKIELKHLIWLSAVSTSAEIAWCVIVGNQVLLCWSIAFGYSLLMRYEFFASAFLKKRLVMYAISHMLIMPLIITWIWSAYASISLHLGLFLLALLSLLSGFSFEIARKIHSGDGERETVDSYSKTMGYTISILVVLLLVLVGTAVQFFLLYRIDATSWSFVTIGGLYLMILMYYIFLIRNAVEKKLRIAEILVSLFMLVSYLSIIVEINF